MNNINNKYKILFSTNGDESSIYFKKSIDSYNIFFNKNNDNFYFVPNCIYGLNAFLKIINYAIQNNFEYVIYLDIDCFVYDTNNLNKLFEQFVLSECICAGMPDGAVNTIRKHNKYQINPFLCFFNITKIKKYYINGKIQLTNKIITATSIENENNLNKVIANNLINAYKLDMFEQYYRLFGNFLLNNEKFMYFLSKNKIIYNDNWTTGIFIDKIAVENIVCLHTWYSRNKSKENINRINRIIEICKNKNNAQIKI